VLWAGTLEGGVFKIDNFTKKFFYLNKLHDHEKEFNMVFDVKIDRENNLWIGCFRNGLYKCRLMGQDKILDSKTENYYFFENRGIKIIFIDLNGDIWILTSSYEIFKYIKGENRFELWVDLVSQGYKIVFTISEYKTNINHYLLLGTDKNGIVCFETNTKLISEFTEIYVIEPRIEVSSVTKLFLDNFNNLWIGIHNHSGIFKIFLNDYSVKYYNGFEIGRVYEDRSNNIWIGSVTGLIKYDRKLDLFQIYTTKNGLPDNKIYGILEDKKGNIWVSTRKTISRFDLISESFKNYEYEDGLYNEEFWIACCQDRDGNLYFGGLKGIDYFIPEQIKENPYIPNIVLTDFKIFNESISCSSENPFLKTNISYSKEVSLTYNENVFSFKFASLIYNSPQKNQFAHKMEGFDKDWIYCGTRRQATYTNLDPGEYVFRVKGSNNDGIWNEEGTAVKIRITPPYWKTWWFRSIGVFGLMAATGMTYKQRLEKIEKEKMEQEEFSRKLIESQENERKRIASELHDTIAHDVLISKNKAMMALKHSDDPERMKSTLEEISELSSATINDVRNISYNLHPHQLERLGFTKTIRSIINEVSKSTNIDFSFESDNMDELLSKETEINLFRVIQESVNNIIKHSGADKAELKLSRLENFILVILRDNGKGFKVDKKEVNESNQGYGLSGISERIKFMKGEIHIEAEVNKGTAIFMKIPIKNSDGKNQ
ncbi:MAG: triple tyrosine motif-containing protein, partial [bacterium]